MLCSSQSGSIRWAKRMLACLVLLFSAVLLCYPSYADPVVPPIPQTSEWISGPGNADLGNLASLKIPQGYKFIGESGARAQLERMTNSVPKGLVGILSPEAGGWWIVLKFADIGYVKDDDQAKMDPTAILKSVWQQIERQNVDLAKQGLPLTTSVDWELKPLYDANDRTLEWALRAQIQPQPVVSHTVRLFGRHGVLEAMVVRPYKGFSDLAPLKQLIKNISFKAGEQYADFKKGDKLSTSRLAELITAEDVARPALASVAGLAVRETRLIRSPGFWIGLGFVTCAAVILLALVVRKIVRRESLDETKTAPRQTVAATSVTGNGSKPRDLSPPPQTSRATLEPKPEPPAKPVNGKHHGGRRKKVFDYNRYFTDLNSAVSSHANQFEPPSANEYPQEATRLPAALPSYTPALPSQPVLPSLTTEVIAHQRAIIEEQKRLIHEQTRLIEEKSKLIAEKNQLLKMQSEFFEHKLL